MFGVRGPPRPPGSPLAARDPPCRQAANPPCKDPRPTSNFLPPVAFHSLPEYDRQPAHITANPYGNSARRHFTTDKLRFLLPLFRGSRDCERTSRGIAYGISPTRNTVIWQEPYKELGEPEHEASIAAATLPYTTSVEHRLVPYISRVQTRMGGNWLCPQSLAKMAIWRLWRLRPAKRQTLKSRHPGNLREIAKIQQQRSTQYIALKRKHSRSLQYARQRTRLPRTQTVRVALDCWGQDPSTVQLVIRNQDSSALLVSFYGDGWAQYVANTVIAT